MPRHNIQTMDTMRAKSVVDENGCWIWQGTIDRDGYGQCSYRNRSTRAHRASWLIFGGIIPWDRPHLDHLCGVTACINPDHLQAVSHEENQRRAAARRPTCGNGHPWVPENTYEGRGYRACRACGRERRRRYVARQERRANAR